MGKKKFYPKRKMLALLHERYYMGLFSYLGEHGVPQEEIGSEINRFYSYVSNHFELTRGSLPTKNQVFQIADDFLIQRTIDRVLYRPTKPAQARKGFLKFSKPSKNRADFGDDEEVIHESDEDTGLIYSKTIDDDISRSVSHDLLIVDSELVKYLSKHPKLMYELDPRKFEELIAALLEDLGYDVGLTSRSRDSGVDVYATQSSRIGDMLLIVQCKRYSPLKRVGVGVVRELYGVAEQLKATMAMVATTSFFTQPAREFQVPVSHRLSLRDYSELVTWLKHYGCYQPGAIRAKLSPNPVGRADV